LDSEIKKVLKLATIVPVCSWCVGRQLTSNVGRAKELGDSIGARTVPEGCTLCCDSYAKKDELTEKVIEQLQDFEFATFQVGVSISKACIEKEDELKTKFKLNKGIGVKKALTILFKTELSNRLQKEIKNENWDVLAQIDVSKRFVSIHSSPIVLLVKYVKLEHGIHTKQPNCTSCNGSGCEKCNNKGYELGSRSVENIISEEFTRAFESNKISISWSGIDDSDTLVLGNGRPVYLRILEPRKRYSGFLNLNRRQGNPVQFPLIELVNNKTYQFEGLRKFILYRLSTCKHISDEQVELLYSLKNIEIKNHANKRRLIYWLRPVSFTEKEISLLCYMDNGVNPWKVMKGFENNYGFKGILNLLGLDCDLKMSFYVMGFEEVYKL
jgi:tRNA pseudouridine synthase 10